MQRDGLTMDDAQGRQLWNRLHQRPSYVTVWHREGAWLDAFAASIPCEECRAHWREIVRESPPPTRNHLAYFDWTWRAHNTVNARLGKPQYDQAAARKRYGWPPPTGDTVSLPILTATELQAERRLEICQRCVDFLGHLPEQGAVRCRKGKRCCGGEIREALVYPLVGSCVMERWNHG